MENIWSEVQTRGAIRSGLCFWPESLIHKKKIMDPGIRLTENLFDSSTKFSIFNFTNYAFWYRMSKFKKK